MNQPNKKEQEKSHELTSDEKALILRTIKEHPDNEKIVCILAHKFNCSSAFIMGLLIDDTIAKFTPQNELDSPA